MENNNKYFKILVQLLPKSDPRYKQWRKSLKNRPEVWNKGKTKETDSGVKKISQTMKRKKIDNFVNWRQKMIKAGKIIIHRPPLKYSAELATLIGLVLGDGNIYKHPRVEKLTISLGTDKPKLISYTQNLIGKVFNKEPSLYKQKKSNCVQVYIYQRQISQRLKIPSGNRKSFKKPIPGWIWSSKKYLIACLKGLYEAEASLCIHKPTCTYNFSFHNLSPFLLNNVKQALTLLEFHPEVRTYAIRLRKKEEVARFNKLINFRQYS